MNATRNKMLKKSSSFLLCCVDKLNHQTEDGCALFRAFLSREHSEENIEFWIACEEYQKIHRTSKLHHKAKKIFEMFVAVQSPKEVGYIFVVFVFFSWLNYTCHYSNFKSN